MLDGDLPASSSGASLGHKFTAFLLAAAISFGVPNWLKYKASQSASTAELSFDSSAARQIDPGLATAAAPALTLAHSILTDNVVAELSTQAYLAASDMDSRTREFRSRLELTQPSGTVLRVGFRDTDPEKATSEVNAVARTLADWTPASATPAAQAAPTAPVKAPPATAASQPAAPPAEPAVSRQSQSSASLAASLGELAAELSATNRKLDGVGSSSGRTRAGHRSHAYQDSSYRGSSYTQSRQQQLVKAEIKTAQKEVEDLRTRYANQDSHDGLKDRLAEIQEALTSVWPGAGALRSSGSHRFYSAGVNASQIRSERGALTRAISVVERERHAIEQEADARPTPSADVAQAASPSASTPEAAAQSQPARQAQLPQAQPAPVPAPSPSASNQPAMHPLTLVRSAGPAAPIPWWPSIVAGILCGLLYWGVAAWRNRPVDYSGEYDAEETQYSNRLFTPDRPIAAASPVTAAPPVANASREEVLESVPPRRASFFYEPPPAERFHEPPPAESAPSATALSARVDERAAAIAQESVPDNPEPAPFLRENMVEIADPWNDLIKKAIAETDIGRRFEGPASDGEKSAAEDLRPNRSDRLAG